MAMLLRTEYIKKIRPYYDSELIKVITGVRRSGKSTLMKQIINEISKEKGPESIIFFDFEDYDNEVFLNEPHLFYSELKKMIGIGKKYVFLDEIQNLTGFEKVIASARSNLNCSIFVTGSNSRLLSGELSTMLTGRAIEFQVLPFSFSEACEYTGKNDLDFFMDYLNYGGFPIRFVEHSTNPKHFSTDLLKSIIGKDIYTRHEIEDRNKFDNFSRFILARSGETISSSSIEGYTSFLKDKIVKSTCYQYLNYMEEAFLVSSCSRYDIKGKAALATLKKYYAMDTSFIFTSQSTNSANLGFILETVVHNELIVRGYNVYIGKTYKGEIDFFVTSEKGHCYIQVCYLLANEEIINREFGAYSSVKDSYPKYVLSMDSVLQAHNGIIHDNIIHFLLDKNFLNFT